FEGKVIQVIEDGDEVQIRLAVSGNYDKVVLCSYKKSITPSRVLEDDYITIRGISAGTITYESTMGGNITIPGIAVEKIN
ncbi:putative negative regulator, partial [Clostridioides difficile Y312]